MNNTIHHRPSQGIAVALLLSLIFSASAFAQNGDAILGVWLSEHKDAKIRLEKRGQEYFGRIIWLKEPNFAADHELAGKAKIDYQNPDASLRTRPVTGLEMVWGFRYENARWVDGRVYDPKKGKTYRGTISLSRDDRLQLCGYVGIPFFGRTTIWTREAPSSK